MTTMCVHVQPAEAEYAGATRQNPAASVHCLCGRVEASLTGAKCGCSGILPVYGSRGVGWPDVATTGQGKEERGNRRGSREGQCLSSPAGHQMITWDLAERTFSACSNLAWPWYGYTQQHGAMAECCGLGSVRLARLRRRENRGCFRRWVSGDEKGHGRSSRTLAEDTLVPWYLLWCCSVIGREVQAL